MKSKTLLGALALAGFTVFSAPAMATAPAACTGIDVFHATVADVMLDGSASDGCVISGVNPQQGPNGNTSGFSGTFGTGWSLLAKMNSTHETATFGTGPNLVNYTLDYTKTTTTNGTWTIKVDKPVVVDLVFALHASDHSGAFLFDNQVLVASPLSNPGSWVINWHNNGGNIPDFSNLTLFARQQTLAVPEPETYAMLLAGLGLVGFAARRRKA